jgi:AcrR family transcriptional regulator
MAVGQVNAQDPRVKRTRKLLQQTLMELMGEQSFDSITVQDIATRSTLNRATFYAHFEDKYDLLDSIVREGVEEALAAAVRADAPLSAQMLRALCRTVCVSLAQVQDHCGPRHRQFDPLLERAVQEVLHRVLVRALRQVPATALPGGARDVASWDVAALVETVAGMLSWALFGTASQWSRGPRTESADEVAAQVVTVLTEGLGTAFVAA